MTDLEYRGLTLVVDVLDWWKDVQEDEEVREAEYPRYPHQPSFVTRAKLIEKAYPLSVDVVATREPKSCDDLTVSRRYAELTEEGFVLNPTNGYWERVDCCLSDAAVRYVDDETWYFLLPRSAA